MNVSQTSRGEQAPPSWNLRSFQDTPPLAMPLTGKGYEDQKTFASHWRSRRRCEKTCENHSPFTSHWRSRRRERLVKITILSLSAPFLEALSLVLCHCSSFGRARGAPANIGYRAVGGGGASPPGGPSWGRASPPGEPQGGAYPPGGPSWGRASPPGEPRRGRASPPGEPQGGVSGSPRTARPTWAATGRGPPAEGSAIGKARTPQATRQWIVIGRAFGMCEAVLQARPVRAPRESNCFAHGLAFPKTLPGPFTGCEKLVRITTLSHPPPATPFTGKGM